ncbi:MAG TPA: DNA alkylation repair protein [Ktedonobacterales bacterium]|jgi:3-methyladenine DNA glycosylase AlkD|nr:DNA alkylation repair protein [Ktedonobacterales bacterium]
MDSANTALIGAVREGLAQLANPEKAVAMQAYMRSVMPYLGVQMPQQRQLYRQVFATHPLATFDEWQATVLALWREARYREERYAAIALTGDRRYRQFLYVEALPLYEELIVTGAWWDLVDELATHRIGDLLRHYPEPMRATMLAWSRDADLWKRRTAILCQATFKAATDEQLLFACIEPNLSDKDFFIRKAIGWALREYARVRPDSVRRYVREHEAALSGLSRREAMKHLSADA